MPAPAKQAPNGFPLVLDFVVVVHFGAQAIFCTALGCAVGRAEELTADGAKALLKVINVLVLLQSYAVSSL